LASRDWFPPVSRDYILGFRVARLTDAPALHSLPVARFAERHRSPYRNGSPHGNTPRSSVRRKWAFAEPVFQVEEGDRAASSII
jgi:hypothetical protein